MEPRGGSARSPRAPLLLCPGAWKTNLAVSPGSFAAVDLGVTRTLPARPAPERCGRWPPVLSPPLEGVGVTEQLQQRRQWLFSVS